MQLEAKANRSKENWEQNSNMKGRISTGFGHRRTYNFNATDKGSPKSGPDSLAKMVGSTKPVRENGGRRVKQAEQPQGRNATGGKGPKGNKKPA